MRKSILFALLCTVAIVAVACGGGNNSKVGNSGPAGSGDKGEAAAADPEAQWKALYKKDAEWVVKMDYGTVMHTKTKVISVDGTKAKTKTWTAMGAEAKFEGDGTDADAEYKKADPAAKPDEKWKETGKGSEKVKDWDCNWTEGTYDGKKQKTWMSKDYNMVVKMEVEGKVTMELTSFKAGS